MEGVRLFHDVARHATVTVEIPHVPYKQTYLCPTCNIHHRNKTIHLNFDGQGAAIVSRSVLAMLMSVGLPRMSVESTVVKPPATRINLNGGSAPKIIREATNRIVVYDARRRAG